MISINWTHCGQSVRYHDLFLYYMNEDDIQPLLHQYMQIKYYDPKKAGVHCREKQNI